MSSIASIEMCFASDSDEIKVSYSYQNGPTIEYGAKSVDEVVAQIGEVHGTGLYSIGDGEFPKLPIMFEDLFVQIYQPGIECNFIYDGIVIYMIGKSGGVKFIPRLDTIQGPLVPKKVEIRTTSNDNSYVIFHGKCGKTHFEDQLDHLCYDLKPETRWEMIEAFRFDNPLKDRKTIRKAFQKAYGPGVIVVFTKIR